MEKRIFIAVLVSIALLWGWAVLAPKLFPDLAKAKPPAPAQTETAPRSTQPSTATTTSEQSPQPSTTTKSAPLPTTPIEAARLEYATIERPGFIARFSNRGAELVSFQLTGYKTKDGKANVELVKGRDASRTDFPFAIEGRSGAIAARLNTALWAVRQFEDKGDTVLEYRYAAPDIVAATKTFRIHGDYLFDFEVAVQPPTPYRIVAGPGIRTLEPD